MKYHAINLGDKRLHYNIKKWKKQGSFEIIRDISENVNLVQLVDTVGNVNNSVSIVGYWIFDSKHKKELPLATDSLKLICSPLVG